MLPKTFLTRACAPILAIGLTIGLAAGLAPSAAATPAERATADRPSPGEALADARALFDGRKGTASHGRDATLVLRDLFQARDDLTGAERRQADRLLARPTDGPADPADTGYEPGTPVRTLCKTRICVHWVESTGDAVDPTDADSDGFPDYVEETAATLDGVHATYQAAGYRAPKPDGSLGGNALPDIYLVNIGPDGLYGYCTSDEPEVSGQYDYWAYCVLDNDYAADEFPSNTPLENMRVTAAHEYFHAVQFAYDAYEDGWFMEATATWAEDELFDGVDDNLFYLPHGPLGRPWIPLDAFVGLHQYGDWIFFRYLTERHTASQGGMPTLVRDMWRRADSTRGTAQDYYSLQAVEAVLKDRGASLTKTFASFADANRRPAKTYDEGAANNYPTPPLAAQVTLSPQQNITTWGEFKLDHLTSATVRFTPSKKMKAKAWRLTVELNLAPRNRGSAAVVTVYRKSGGTDVKHAKLNRKGDDNVKVPFSRKKVSRVEVTLVNASDRFDCWTDSSSPYSCLGTPKDENLKQKLRGIASR